MRLRHINNKKEKNSSKRYYKAIKYPEISLSMDDIYIITTVGDRLDNLANQFYKDVDLWWIISISNPGVIRRDSLNLKPGLEIRIPTNISAVKKQFELINK